MRVKIWMTGILLLAMRGLSVEQMSANGVIYVNTYKAIAIAEEQRSGVPAAIILAQGLHESEAGTSELCKASNNHFGIKCRDDWKGPVVYHDDDARHECFRSYACAADSYRDHSDFLRNGSRYAFLFQLDPADYEGWAYGLRKAGYATNVRYSQILIKFIKDYNLQQYTLIAMGKIKPEDEVALTMPGGTEVTKVPNEDGRGTTPSRSSAVTPISPSVGAGGATAVDSGMAAGSAATAGQAAAAPEVAYPEGEFTINRTKVIYVRAGVSLLAIANQYDIPLGRLLEFNDMQQEDVLVKGQLLFLQRKRRTGQVPYHVVQTGESLYDISQAEGVRFEDMLEMNQLTPGVQPAAGERIYLQGTAPSRPRLADNKR